MHIRYPGRMLAQISSMSYHARSNSVFLTSRQPERRASIAFFHPAATPPPKTLEWHAMRSAGSVDSWQTITMNTTSAGGYAVANCVVAAPDTAKVACAMGTTDGIVTLSNDNHPVLQSALSSRQAQAKRSWEILDVDFAGADQPDLLFAAGRKRQVWLGDLRAPAEQWVCFKHRSGVAHVRAAGGNGVLVSGLENAMALYDTRYLRDQHTTEQQRADGRTSRPVFTFEAYKNAQRPDLGLAILPEAPYGVVVTAHDGGSMALHSLRSGRRMGSPVLDDLKTPGPIKAMQWATMPGDVHPSLFVGRGYRLEKYSFGVLDGGNEE
jgi:hypothetical protein